MVIEKAGEVIPAVVRVVLETTPPAPSRSTSLPYRRTLPGMRRPHQKSPQFAAWVCENPQCPAQRPAASSISPKRGALDLEGLGGIVADTTLSSEAWSGTAGCLSAQARRHLARSVWELIRNRASSAGRTPPKLLEAIQNAPQLPLAHWLHALAIPEIGEETAHDLAMFHQSLDAVAGSGPPSQTLSRLIACAARSRRRTRAREESSVREPERQALAGKHGQLVREAEVGRASHSREVRGEAKKRVFSLRCGRQGRARCGPEPPRLVCKRSGPGGLAADLTCSGIRPQGSAPSGGRRGFQRQNVRPHRLARDDAALRGPGVDSLPGRQRQRKRKPKDRLSGRRARGEVKAGRRCKALA